MNRRSPLILPITMEQKLKMLNSIEKLRHELKGKYWNRQRVHSAMMDILVLTALYAAQDQEDLQRLKNVLAKIKNGTIENMRQLGSTPAMMHMFIDMETAHLNLAKRVIKAVAELGWQVDPVFTTRLVSDVLAGNYTDFTSVALAVKKQRPGLCALNPAFNAACMHSESMQPRSTRPKWKHDPMIVHSIPRRPQQTATDY